MAGHHPVAGHDLRLHSEVAATVRDELVHFFECAGIEEQLDPLADRQLACVVLAFLTRFAATQLCAPLQIGEGLMRICHG